MSLIEDQLDWTARDWEIAAAVLGTAAGRLLHTIAGLPETAPEHASRAPYNAECARIAVRLAQDAAHCAAQAESESDKIARFLGAPALFSPVDAPPGIGERTARAYRAYMERFPLVDDPRR